MKKILVLLLVLAFMAAAAIAIAGQVAGSHHDLSASSTSGTQVAGQSVCGSCHIPHGGVASITGLPIWARNMTLPNGGGAYSVYGSTGTPTSSNTLSNTVVNAPGPFSLTCLSCHDGTLAMNTITKNGINLVVGAVTTSSPNVDSTTGKMINFVNTTTGYDPYFGTNLQNDHPIGLAYRGTAATLAGLAATVPSNYPLYGASNNQMECSTCHDPHNETTHSPFLRVDAATMCSECHSAK